MTLDDLKRPKSTDTKKRKLQSPPEPRGIS